MFVKNSNKRVLNCGEYDIGWDYDVYSLHFCFNYYYSKPLCPSSPSQEQYLKSAGNADFIINMITSAETTVITNTQKY